jgi:hypothetical protein
MTSIQNVSAGFIESYMNFQSKEKLTADEMFKRLSLEMGGDGETITKAQLDNYINKAETGSISVGDPKLSALKLMQKNWDTISDNKGSITVDDMRDFTSLLSAAMVDTSQTLDDSDDTEDSSEDDKINNDSIIITAEDLTVMIKSVLSNSSNDESNSNLVANLTNQIANNNSASTIQVEG